MKAEAFVEANDLKKVTIIKQSKHQEQQKVSTRAIRYILKKLKDRAVMKVEVTQNGDLVELTCKTDGERERVCVCVLRNMQSNYSQLIILRQCNSLSASYLANLKGAV